MTRLCWNSLTSRESLNDTTGYREQLDAKRPHCLSSLLFQPLSAAGMTLRGGRGNESWVLCPSFQVSMLSIAETYLSPWTTIKEVFHKIWDSIFYASYRKCSFKMHCIFDAKIEPRYCYATGWNRASRRVGTPILLSAPCD